MKAKILTTLALIITSISAQDGKVPITTSSKEALALYIQARQFSQTVQPLTAKPLYEKALKLDPNFVMAQFGLSGTIGQPGPRREAFKKALEMSERVKLSEGFTLRWAESGSRLITIEGERGPMPYCFFEINEVRCSDLDEATSIIKDAILNGKTIRLGRDDLVSFKEL